MSRTPWMSKLRALARAAREERDPATGPSRREVLASLGAALAAVPAFSAAGCSSANARVAIVGGGLSGVHVAYRLQQAGVDFVLFEGSDRLGGRTHTGRDLFLEGQVCELGGELVDTGHANMWGLAEELGLQLDDRQGAPYDTLHAETLWFGDAEVSEETILEQFRAVLPGMIADFDAAESDDDAFVALDQETLAAWLARRVPPETYPELHGLITVAYRGEFGLETAQQSALNLVYFIGLDDDAFRIFGASDERYHTHTGNDSYVSLMAATLPAERVRLGHRLTRAAGRRGFDLRFETAEGEVNESFDKVVFALPYTILRGVDIADLALSDLKRQIINELGMGQNTKVMMGFTSPFWRDAYQAAGAVTTDLPFQQCWDTSLGQSGSTAILTNFLGGDQAVAAGEGEATAWAETVVLPGLDDVYPGTSEAFTGTAVRMHWPSHPFSLGSYLCYTPGQWQFWSYEGEQEGDLHFAGSQTSMDWGGWMEGAADAGSRAALEVLADMGREVPEAFRALAELQAILPRPILGRRNPIRWMRERRVVLRAWAERRRGN